MRDQRAESREQGEEQAEKQWKKKRLDKTDRETRQVTGGKRQQRKDRGKKKRGRKEKEGANREGEGEKEREDGGQPISFFSTPSSDLSASSLYFSASLHADFSFRENTLRRHTEHVDGTRE